MEGKTIDNRLTKDFYLENATILAPKLLGKYICRRIKDVVIRKRIEETECYYGFFDSASHAHRKRTMRNAPMFEAGGITYIYLCYGIHYLLNVVSGSSGHPEAVLIRQVDGANGSALVTRSLELSKAQNCLDLSLSDELWLEDGDAPREIIRLPRVGINYAQKDDIERLWRFKGVF